MKRATDNKIILVTRRTRLNELVARFNTVKQAQFYIEHQHADFSDYQSEHADYQTAITAVSQALQHLGRVQIVDRAFLPNFVFAPQDTVVVLGQDGLVANTLKYLNGQPVIGVNPDPRRWDGVLLPFQVKEVGKIVAEVFAKRRPLKTVTMAQATLNNGQCLYAVNDLFIGPKSHLSARYQIQSGHVCEQHSSSGIIVSTGLGSTGWFKSLVEGATRMAAALSGQNITHHYPRTVPWDADYLYFTVREPFPSTTSKTTLVFGRVTAYQPLELVSAMPEYGVIFSDGIESDFVEFNSGTHATISVADKQGYLVV